MGVCVGGGGVCFVLLCLGCVLWLFVVVFVVFFVFLLFFLCFCCFFVVFVLLGGCVWVGGGLGGWLWWVCLLYEGGWVGFRVCKCGFLSEFVVRVWGTRWGGGILFGEWVEPGGLIWMAPRGGYVPRLNARDGWWGVVLREFGVPRVTPHELRHTVASLAV